MPQIIAGQPCYNCSDVARTQKAQQLGVSPSQIGPDGQVKPDPNKIEPTRKSGENQPLSTGPRGTSVNILG